MKKVLSIVLAIIITCSMCLVSASAAGSKYDATNYTLAEIEANENLTAIGATKPEYVVAKFSEDNSEVIITKNGKNSDGVVTKNHSFIYSTLEKIVLGDGVKNFTANNFYCCDSLTTFEVSSNNEDYTTANGVLFSKDMKTLIQFPTGKTVTSYTVPDGVKSIGELAFARASFKNVNLPLGLTTIEQQAFKECSNLVNIDIPEGMKEINMRAFMNCSSIKSISFSSTIEKIDAWALEDCIALNNVVVADGCTSVTGHVLSDTPFYNDEKNWDNGALYAGNCLIELNRNFVGEYAIREGTTTIANDAFAYCYTVTNVDIPKNVTTIGERAFYGCVSLEEVTIPEGVKEIQANTFRYCEELRGVTIPNSITSIGEDAFCECNNLTDVYFVGVEVEWDKIAIDDCGNDALLNATIHFVYNLKIQPPSRTTIRCKDGIVLHANVTGTLPEGAKIVWSANNKNFTTKQIDDETFQIVSNNNGYTTITASIIDADGKVLATDTIEMYSRAGFFDKIGGFFRSLFGGTKIYES